MVKSAVPVWPITPLKIKSLVLLIVASLPRVMLPETVLLLLLVNAPMPPTPVPFKVKASAIFLLPLKVSVAPESTVVPAAVVPSAESLAATKVPALTVVKP